MIAHRDEPAANRPIGARLGVSRPVEILAAGTFLFALLIVPYAFRPYVAHSLALFLIYGLLAMSLNFIWGYAGIVSFGQNAFFGVAAYAYGVIAINSVVAGNTTFIAVIGGVGTATLLAALFSYLMFYGRISDVYASVIVLVLSLMLYSFAVSTAGDEWVIGSARIGGFNGLFGQGSSGQNIDNFQIPAISASLPWLDAPFVFRLDRSHVSGYYLVVGACVGSYLAARLLLRTRLGRVAAAIRENEDRAASLGYDIRAYKAIMFTVAGAIAGTAGVLFASWGRFVNPDVFSLTFAASVVVYVLLGGRLTLIGGFAGALAVNYLTNFLAGVDLTASASDQYAWWTGILLETARRLVQQAPLLVQGIVLIAAVLLLRDGIVPMLRRQIARRTLIVPLVIIPAVAAFFALNLACRQAGLCIV